MWKSLLLLYYFLHFCKVLDLYKLFCDLYISFALSIASIPSKGTKIAYLIYKISNSTFLQYILTVAKCLNSYHEKFQCFSIYQSVAFHRKSVNLALNSSHNIIWRKSGSAGDFSKSHFRRKKPLPLFPPMKTSNISSSPYRSYLASRSPRGLRDLRAAACTLSW